MGWMGRGRGLVDLKVLLTRPKFGIIYMPQRVIGTTLQDIMSVMTAKTGETPYLWLSRNRSMADCYFCKVDMGVQVSLPAP